jgi:hypothetical protein
MCAHACFFLAEHECVLVFFFEESRIMWSTNECLPCLTTDNEYQHMIKNLKTSVHSFFSKKYISTTQYIQDTHIQIDHYTRKCR